MLLMRLCPYVILLLSACNHGPLNDPYPAADSQKAILYSSFSERPKHLDPAVAYSSNEYTFIGQIYEAPLQYHYLKRPYELEALAATKMPTLTYRDAQGKVLPADAPANQIVFTDYLIEIKAGMRYQNHPALAVNQKGEYLYHNLSDSELEQIATLNDFSQSGSREVIAEDYVYQIKRLANPKVQSPIAGLMQEYIEGFKEFTKLLSENPNLDLKTTPMKGLKVLGPYSYQITVRGKYPQFKYWLAMPFFVPMPWEADRFYAQKGLKQKNITLDWYPLGSGPYFLSENNPNRRMALEINPNFHGENFPTTGEPADVEQGLLKDSGKPLPFIKKVEYVLEKETIPYWNKFLQGYYDASGIASDSFDQAIQFAANGHVQLTEKMQAQGMHLQTEISNSIYYMGFNMLDSVVGGDSERARKLRQALAIAVDYEEYIAIFMNGRGVAAQGILPPGIYGNESGQAGMNPLVYEWRNGQYQRKPISAAQKLMQEAGYPDGIDPKTGESLILYLDSTSVSTEDRPMLNWYRKQFEKLGIKLVIRSTDYNRFQQKMSDGNAQIFMWGWHADYPDPENFFFLLYGPNSKVKQGGENATNYANPEFDHLFEAMRTMDDSDERMRLIRELQAIIRRDSPWLFGYHPKSFTLFHSWYLNSKANLLANNKLKYLRIDADVRAERRKQWNQPRFLPLFAVIMLFVLFLWPALRTMRQASN